MLAWPAFRKRDANPHAALLCERLRDLGVAVDDWTPARAALRAVDLWHLHHPESVVYLRSRLRSTLTTLAFCALLALARARGTRILWTVHDLGSHDRLHPTLEAWFWPFFVSRVDAYVCLSEGGPRLARERFPGLRGRPGFTVPHGHYRDAYPNQVSRAQARRALGLPEQARVLLHFGLVRPYKNVPHLIRTFRELPQSEACSWWRASRTTRSWNARCASAPRVARGCGCCSGGFRRPKSSICSSRATWSCCRIGTS